jgi:iron(III) transport system permease protein
MIKAITGKNQIKPGDLVVKFIMLYLIIAFLVFPNLSMLGRILYKDGHLNSEIFRSLFSSARAMKAMRNSFILAISMVVTVNLIGSLLVFLTEYVDIKGAKILKLGYMSTLIYGGIVLAVSYKFIYGDTGIITRGLLNLFPAMNPKWFSGYGAVIYIMTFACTGNHLIFLTNAIRGIDYQTVEAARNLGASPVKTFFSVVVPVLKPTIFAVTVLTFLTGLSAMSAPLVVGGTDFQTINPLIVSFAKDMYSRDIASLMAVILGAATIILLTVLNRLEKKGNYISISKVKSHILKLKIGNPVINVLLHILAYFLFLVYVVPIALVIIYSFSNYLAIRSGQLNLSQLTLSNYQKLFISPTAYKPFLISISYSAGAAILSVTFTVIISRLIHRSKDKLTPLLEYGTLIPWLLPSTLIALGLMTTFGAPHLIVFNKIFIGTIYLLLIAYTITKLPFSLRMIRASFFSVDKSLEEAAQSLGASPLQAMMRVVLPIVFPAIISVAALNFNGGLAEYDMTAFLYHPLMKPLGIVIRSASDETASEEAITMTFVYAVVLMIMSSITLYFVYGKKPHIKRNQGLMS